MVSQINFEGLRGILYYSQFKPTIPCEIAEGVFVVPSGWQFVPYYGASVRAGRSHFVTPSDWPDEAAWMKFREWVCFDSFLMNPQGTTYFDNGLFVPETVAYTVHEGSFGDEGDCYKTVDYSDVSNFLVDEIFEKPENTPSLSYTELYTKFQTLTEEEREGIEWFVAPPPPARRVDGFYSNYWALLHSTILIEKLIGLPPKCERQSEPCDACGTTPQPHYKINRKNWMRQVLDSSIQDPTIVEEYLGVIDAAIRVRNRISHGPYLDRSSIPAIEMGQTLSYGSERAIAEYKHDSSALLALQIGLRKIARGVIVEQIFGIKHFTSLPELKTMLIGQP